MGKVAVAAAVVGAAAVSVAAMVVVRHRMRNSGKWEKAMDILREFESNCETPIAKLRQVSDAMTVEMHAGLASDGGSKLKMLISYVDNLPTRLVTVVDMITRIKADGLFSNGLVSSGLLIHK